MWQLLTNSQSENNFHLVQHSTTGKKKKKNTDQNIVSNNHDAPIVWVQGSSLKSNLNYF